MPGNLEFISPPFLISAPVIQINSNEISRGKAPFGWGVCSSPQLSPIQRPFSPERRPSNPPPPPSVALLLQHVEEWIWGAVTHKHWEPELLSRLVGILPKFMNFHPRLVRSAGIRPNQRGRDKMETKFDKWTNSGGFDFIHSVSVVDYRSCPLSGSWLEELYMI